MTIQRDDGELICTCDECGNEEYGGWLKFNDFIQQLKDDGWRIRKELDVWQHFCPDCQD